jgi:hypothetical protein
LEMKILIFFQAMATYSFRRNLITNLTLDDGTCVTEHSLKARALLTALRRDLESLNLVGFFFTFQSFFTLLAFLKDLMHPFP